MKTFKEHQKILVVALFHSTMTINRTDTMLVHYPSFQLQDLIRLSPISPVDTWVKGFTETQTFHNSVSVPCWSVYPYQDNTNRY